MVKLEAIRAFVVVVRHGNLRDAAQELGRTQSALSMALSQLEQMLGGALFETDRKRDLTDLGRFVHDTGEKLVREHDRVQELIFDYAKGKVGRLRIASVPSVAALILPDLLRGFMDSHPGAQIDLMDSDSQHVRSMVADGLVDLGIAGPAPMGQPLHEVTLFHDTLHVVCHVDSDFAKATGGLRWCDLTDASLIANQTNLVLEAPDARAVTAESRLFARNVSSLFAMIESGLGTTVLPGLATRNLSPTLKAIPLVDDRNTRAICLLSRAGRTESPLTKAFRACLAAAMPKIASDLALGSEA